MEDRELSARLAALRAGGALALLAFAASAGAAEAPGVAAGEAQPEAVDVHRLHQEAAESFTAWDGDRDGFVAAPEAMEMTPEAFAAADRDGDGKLDLVEWVDARFPDAPRPAPPAPR